MKKSVLFIALGAIMLFACSQGGNGKEKTDATDSDETVVENPLSQAEQAEIEKALADLESAASTLKELWDDPDNRQYLVSSNLAPVWSAAEASIELLLSKDENMTDAQKARFKAALTIYDQCQDEH